MATLAEESVAVTPFSIGVIHHYVPRAFHAANHWHFAWYAGKSPLRMVRGSSGKRICRVKNEILDGIHSCPSPTIPFDMPELSSCWYRFCLETRLEFAGV